MDRQKSRKGHESRRLVCGTPDFSLDERDVVYNEKSKYKRRVYNEKKKYEMSPNSYSVNWPTPPRIQPIAQRQFPTSESSFCHYSVPLSLSFEPVSLPIYSALIQPQGNCPVPLEIESYATRSKHHGKYSKNRKSKAKSCVDQNKVPAMFHTPRLNNGDHQDYTSLPPVNCDIYATKPSDTEAACKRRFSDPGIGQVSSDEMSSSRSDDSSNSSQTAEFQSLDFFGLVEQVNSLKENNSYLEKELRETKLELESLKMQHQNWKSCGDDFKPGDLSDAINEIRTAVKLGEEALISKVTQMLEKNSLDCKEAQIKLEEKLKEEMNGRFTKLEEQLTKMSQHDTDSEISLPEQTSSAANEKDPVMQQQLVELEQEKIQLRKQLQEAVAKKEAAEGSTEKLERLVGILRKKINGVSIESCIPEDKQFLTRPLASSLEKNPFIIANNKQGQEQKAHHRSKISPIRAFPQDHNDAKILNDNKENETAETGNSNGNTNTNSVHSSNDATSVTAQVTITGPVTDLVTI